MRRLLTLVGIGLVGSLFTPSTPASACDPQRPPYCMTVCNTVPPAYSSVRYRLYQQDIVLPTWYELDLGVCGS